MKQFKDIHNRQIRLTIERRQHIETTPVTEKYLCVVVKILVSDLFIITAYFTDTIKRGKIVWEKK